MHELFPAVFEINGKLATRNLVPGQKVYNEKLVRVDGVEYRLWDPFRSKLAAVIKKGLKHFPFHTGQHVLYLGASTGTTVSHISDIVGEKGEIYAIEISPQPMQNLLKLCEKRNNIYPLLADAQKPEGYADIEQVDAIYQDVAQPDQDDILIKNAQQFLRAGGHACLAIKSQSIDVTKKPAEVFKDVLATLEHHFSLVESYTLEPFDKDHLFALLEKR